MASAFHIVIVLTHVIVTNCHPSMHTIVIFRYKEHALAGISQVLSTSLALHFCLPIAVSNTTPNIKMNSIDTLEQGIMVMPQHKLLLKDSAFAA